MTTANNTPTPAAPATPASVTATLYPNAATMGDPAAGAAPAPAPAGEPAPAAAAPAPAAEPAPAATGEPAPSDQPPAAPTAAELATRYPIEFPEGFTPNESTLGQFRELAAKANLEPAVAQQLFGMYTEALQQQVSDANAAVTAQQTQWHGEVMAFPEFAPDQRERTSTMVSRVMEEFGTPEGRQWLTESGMGNNPHLVRLVLNLTNALMEGEPTPQGGITRSPGKPPKPTSLGQAIYGDTYDKQ